MCILQIRKFIILQSGKINMLIFESSYSNYPMWYLVISVVFFIFFINIIINKKFIIFLKKYYKQKFNKSFFAILTLALSFGYFMATEPLSYFNARKAMEKEKFLTVSGLIKNFIPKEKCSSHKFESFTVNNVKFEYSNHDNSNAYYHKVKCTNKSILKNNLKVKIDYLKIDGKYKIIRIIKLNR